MSESLVVSDQPIYHALALMSSFSCLVFPEQRFTIIRDILVNLTGLYTREDKFCLSNINGHITKIQRYWIIFTLNVILILIRAGRLFFISSPSGFAAQIQIWVASIDRCHLQTQKYPPHQSTNKKPPIQYTPKSCNDCSSLEISNHTRPRVPPISSVKVKQAPSF